MNRRQQFGATVASAIGGLLCGFQMCAAQEIPDGVILDRVAVVVNQRVITESEVIRDLRVAAFLDGEPVDLSGESKREAAGRLVDQLLMLAEAETSHLALPTIEAAGTLANRAREDYPDSGQFEAALAAYKIDERDLALHLLLGLQTLTFTELRFRPGIQIPEADIQATYEELVPPAERNREGGGLEENRRRIEDLLTDRRVIDALDEWLEEARGDIRIRYRRPVFR